MRTGQGHRLSRCRSEAWMWSFQSCVRTVSPTLCAPCRGTRDVCVAELQRALQRCGANVACLSVVRNFIADPLRCGKDDVGSCLLSTRRPKWNSRTETATVQQMQGPTAQNYSQLHKHEYCTNILPGERPLQKLLIMLNCIELIDLNPNFISIMQVMCQVCVLRGRKH